MVLMGHSLANLRLTLLFDRLNVAYSFSPTRLRQSNLKSGFGENSLGPEIPPDKADRELFNGAGEQWGAKTTLLGKACLRAPGNFSLV